MFIRFKRLSKSIQRRVLDFYDCSFNDKFFRRREINELMGSSLRHLVTMEKCRELLTGNYFFKQLPDELLNSLADSMSETLFLPNDIICKVDSTRTQVNFSTKSFLSFVLLKTLQFDMQKLFLILTGTVAVYTEAGEEVLHLHDGNMFGETAFLVYDEKYVNYANFNDF